MVSYDKIVSMANAPLKPEEGIFISVTSLRITKFIPKVRCYPFYFRLSTKIP